MLFRDVSERKKLEIQLQRSQKLEALGTLVGGVAHDLNNILSALTSYPELLLLDLPEDSELRVPLQTIERSGLKAAAIVQDMLTLSRRNNIVKKNIDLNHSVLEYLQSPEYKKLLEFHVNINITTDLTEEVDLICALSIHMAKCIMNLVSNGVEAMPAGGDLIIRTENIFLKQKLSAYSSIKKGTYVLLQIIDSGVGISTEDLQQMYDPFYSKKKMGRSGTGLGMTIVWNSVADHDGYITVESKEGSGTRFSLYFPSNSSVENSQEKVIKLDDCIGNESILVVDDMLEQRIVASAMLSKMGYSVSVAASGGEAVEFLRENKVDVLVLDMIMPPGMDGLDTYRKTSEIHPGQKVVIASGFAETKRVKELQRLGGGGFVKKPYNLKELGKSIRQELERGA
ncbi:MAG: response regulator [Proteobacteria bacterium]|nr:response regulator [Pseudomonadota bacterium]MBU1058786.1 response regulator [Pseudomonadota bacterium]